MHDGPAATHFLKVNDFATSFVQRIINCSDHHAKRGIGARFGPRVRDEVDEQ